MNESPLHHEEEGVGVDVGEYAHEDAEDKGSHGGFSPRVDRIPSIVSGEELDPFPRFEWSRDASDEMLFHWLCTSRFVEQDIETQRAACVVKRNPFYWMAFLVTFLSLWLGREFHIILGQGGPVNTGERRHEYEVRVHWVYTTSGAMLWVFIRSLLSIAYDEAEGIKVDTVALCVNWVVVACYCSANSVLLRMMRLRHLAGTRTLIVCNAVFSVCMLASLVVYAVEAWWHMDALTTDAALYKAYVLFEKTAAVLFFLLATWVYFHLWSLYKYDGRDLKRRLLETIPALVCACVMLVLMYLGLVYDSSEFRPYVWATFT